MTYDDSEHTAAGWCKRDATTKKCLKDSTNFEYQKVDASSVMDGTNYITFDVKEDMIKPVHLYYQLDNFYQNHRRYVKSRGMFHYSFSNLFTCSTTFYDCLFFFFTCCIHAVYMLHAHCMLTIQRILFCKF